jgi:hypothetical protein
MKDRARAVEAWEREQDERERRLDPPTGRTTAE